MNGHKVKYLYYTATGKSTVTIPRSLINANMLGWEKEDKLNLIITTIDKQKGIFIFKEEK